jgi:biotin operon repressor
MFNLPSKLRADLQSIEARIEGAIRMDERHNILTRMASEREADARRFLADIFADRNGETVTGGRIEDDIVLLRQRRGFHANSKLGKLYRCLASRTYAVTKNTLARESGMTNKSVYQGISTLRGKGYKIESVFGKGSKARYKLAS